MRTGDDHDTRIGEGDTRRLAGLGAGVLLLHLLGWGLYLSYTAGNPALAGLGALAYVLGLRHAFDADHIAAIDCTTRKLLQDGRRHLGVGFCFSLGHSTVVLALTAALALAAQAVDPVVPALQSAGGVIGMTVSGSFLVAIGILNLVVLVDIVRVLGDMRRRRCDEADLEQRLLGQGLMSRVILRRVADRIDASWKLYPLGILFGLGFDTATEIGLLALAAGVATHAVPFLAVISLPLIFAAGMSLVDTADGVLMSRAYGWAFARPVRRVYYNLTVTTLSVAVALLVGIVELLGVIADRLSLDAGPWGAVAGLDLGRLGYVVVALFALIWAGSLLIWKLGRIEQRWSAAIAPGLQDRP